MTDGELGERDGIQCDVRVAERQLVSEVPYSTFIVLSELRLRASVDRLPMIESFQQKLTNQLAQQTRHTFHLCNYCIGELEYSRAANHRKEFARTKKRKKSSIAHNRHALIEM